ncbi:MAG: hypothetical protein M1828_002540 [Chrysothrix sp. TS-e1954]|nr:MAG: hypothetical protein M1828_002540 [Chrysothrix sp. TS-e1954]
MGMYAMGIPAGLVIDKFGVRLGVLLGAIFLGCGYYPMKYAYDGGKNSLNVWVLSVASFFTGLGSCTAFSAAIKTSTFNWPDHRGTATAFPLSGFGLSAFLFSFIANFAFGDDMSGFLLLLSLGTASLNLLSLPFIKLLQPTYPHVAINGRSRSESQRLKRRQSSSMDGSHDQEPRKYNCTNHIAAADELVASNCQEESGPSNETASLTSRSSTASEREGRPEGAMSDSHQLEITGIALLWQVEFWQLFGMLGLLAGVGLMTINNIGNDTKALWRKYDPSKGPSFIRERQQLQVSLISLFSCAGRFASGVGSDILIKRLNASRFWCLEASAIIFTLAQVLAINTSNPNLLFFVAALTGLGYGVLFGVFPALTADAFGVQGLSLNWGFMIFAPVITGNVFNLMYGKTYDSSSKPLNDGTIDCPDGLLCYYKAYYVTLASSILGVVMALMCIRHQSRKHTSYRPLDMSSIRED